MSSSCGIWHGIECLSCERLSSNEDNLRLFLFAADLSKGEKLVKYYSDQLNFEVPTDLATAKPIYDFSCKFMCQEVKRLSNGREEFFKNMSVDEV